MDYSHHNDAASSSSALAAASGMSVAAKRASEEQTEGLEIEMLWFGTVNDEDPCDDPNSTGDSTEASKLDPEVLEAVFSSNGVMVGLEFCPYPVGVSNSREIEAEVNLVARLHEQMVEGGEIKSERPGSDSGYPKKEHDDLKEENDDLKNRLEILSTCLELREALSDFEKKPEGKKIMNDKLKEGVLKLPAAKSEKIDKILVNTSFTKILRTMCWQGANMAWKSNFRRSDLRDDNRFPRFSNEGDEYKWWEENFDPKILQRRLEILRVAVEKSNTELDIFMIINIVSELNSILHPQSSKNELHEKDEVKLSRLLTRIRDLLHEKDEVMSRLLTRIRDLLSGGDSKISGVAADRICIP